MPQILTRAQMAAIIDSGKPLVFDGRLYTDSADLPTQGEIDALYAGATQGVQGETGATGKSAYEIAVDNGFVGTEAEWLESLIPVVEGAITSVNGDEGPDVVLDADDIDDSATTKKFTTQAEKDAWDAKADAQAVADALVDKADITYVDGELANIDLNNLNADNLSSGTIPDARFPATLPAVSGANLTNLPASGGPLFVQTSTKTISDGVEASLFGTGIGSLTLPANYLTVGKTLRIVIRGYVAASGSYYNFIFKVGGATVATAHESLGDSSANSSFFIDILLTCRTTGSSGTVVAVGYTGLNKIGSNGADNLGGGMSTAGTATINTTASLTIDVTSTRALGSASINSLVGIVQPLN